MGSLGAQGARMSEMQKLPWNAILANW